MEDFNKILTLYCGPNAKALEVVEEKNYRGCKIWTFKRRIRKWKFKNECPTYYELKRLGKPFSWNDIPDTEKEYFIDEFYMGLTNFDLEFEQSCEIELQGQTREEAMYRTQWQIDKQYAEQHSTTDIM